ncbi:MAG: hypothetical protein KDA42_04325 [Planctomycetales bacterium]|nr:hypothetical protein [Planctomycetales bacterium]
MAMVSTKTPSALGQQATISTPFNRIGDSFSENINLNWGMNFRNGFFRFGSPAGVGVGPQGGGANLGWNTNFSGGNAFFNLSAGQGSRRSMVMEAPSVTIMNGGTGVISDTVQRPFVISVVPVVGDLPTVPQPQFGPPAQSVLQQRLGRLHAEGKSFGVVSPSDAQEAPSGTDDDQPLRLVNRSSAAAPAASVAAIQERTAREDAAQAQADQQELDLLIARAESAIAKGNPGAARVYLQMAARRAEGDLRQELLEKAKSLVVDRTSASANP